MDAKILYKDYNTRVQEYMNNVIKCLEQDYGKIPESWRISLDLIADNYSLYLQAMDDIKKNGLLRVDNAGRTFKNQCYTIMNSAQLNLRDLLKSFSLTPVSRAKMKALTKIDFNEENKEEYLGKLGYE
jgi:P27 family predicted phage terminase small subunit